MSSSGIYSKLTFGSCSRHIQCWRHGKGKRFKQIWQRPGHYNHMTGLEHLWNGKACGVMDKPNCVWGYVDTGLSEWPCWPWPTVKSTYNGQTSIGTGPQQWVKVIWSNESCFLLHHVEGRVSSILPAEYSTEDDSLYIGRNWLPSIWLLNSWGLAELAHLHRLILES